MEAFNSTQSNSHWNKASALIRPSGSITNWSEQNGGGESHFIQGLWWGGNLLMALGQMHSRIKMNCDVSCRLSSNFELEVGVIQRLYLPVQNVSVGSSYYIVTVAWPGANISDAVFCLQVKDVLNLIITRDWAILPVSFKHGYLPEPVLSLTLLGLSCSIPGSVCGGRKGSTSSLWLCVKLFLKQFPPFGTSLKLTVHHRYSLSTKVSQVLVLGWF